MDKNVENSLLLDFYGPLLTQRSITLMRMHIDEDMSFAEIAEREGISRQGAQQLVARGIAGLRKAEDKLGFLNQHMKLKQRLDGCREALSNGDIELARSLIGDLFEKTLSRESEIMAFESLADRLQAAFKKLSGKGKLSEGDVREAMREVRMALLEADVNFKVVKDFVANVTQRAIGEEIFESLTPAQQVIKIVNDELVALMGGTQARINYGSMPPTVIMLSGLQGAGKTTMAAKLGGYFKKAGKKPLLCACDIYRPAAIKQLQVVGQQVGVPVFEKGTQDPVLTAKEAVEHARGYGFDLVILDTAGRLHIDDELMRELQRICAAVSPNEILLTVDAMTGQDAVNVAETFNEKLSLTGVILTKLDGDTRGGAALSVKAVTGKQIKFAGVGEKLGDIELFYPDRMASRILGMGDVLTLIEKAQESFDEKKAVELEKKMRTQQFTLEDFLDQFQQVRKMGGIAGILKMLPGVKPGNIDVDEKQISRVEAIIRSMTPGERRNPDILNASRRKRIAAGSGMKVEDINRLIKQFEQARQMMKQFTQKHGKRGKRGFPMM